MKEIILKNPITEHLQIAIANSLNKLNFAVPFLNSFALKILNHDHIKIITDKRLITCFDPSCIASFDIPVLKELIKLGFSIRFDNNIHLKLYITDGDTFVTSSNFTKGGFENNVELTVKIDNQNTTHCITIFEEIWQNSEGEITDTLLDANLDKYYLLKKKEKQSKLNKNSKIEVRTIEGGMDSQKVIQEIYKMGDDYSHLRDLTFKANQKKELFKKQLETGFNKNQFYVPEGHSMRHNNLFYDFTYGIESKIAGTGLRELQFRNVFEHPEFRNVVHYIYPQMIGMKPWNLTDEQELSEFCCGLFDFKIPQYTEVLPIRLASYFYPEYFIPIFKLSDLAKICDALKIQTDARTNGEKLFAFSTHIRAQMHHLPHDSNIKFNFAYVILYTFELSGRLEKGEDYNDIISNTKKQWERNYFSKALLVLQRLGMINQGNEKTSVQSA